MTEYGSGGAAAVVIAVTKFNATILANQLSVTVIHNLGRVAKVTGVYGTDQVNPASDFIIINEGLNSFQVGWKSGIAQITDTPVEGAYV